MTSRPPPSGTASSGAVAIAALAIAALAAVPAPAAARAAAPLAESCGEGIVRFHRDEWARAQAAPSLALAAPLPAVGSAPADFPVAPEFLELDGRAAVRVDVAPGTSLYGTGEVPGPLERTGRATTLWNFDAYGYGAHTQSLYQSHPWVLAVRPDGTAFGLLADTTWRCRIDLAHGVLFVADGPPFALIAIDGGSPQAVVSALGRLTGTLPLPPLWALGYHQCRFSYVPDTRVLEVARSFRARRIPADVIWLDIDHMDGRRTFTFNAALFPSPARLTAELRDLGFRTVAIADPGIHRQAGYFVYDSGERRDAWVRDAAGGPAGGRVWPGECVFPDFTRADVRAWWGGFLPDWLARGVDGVWNDMNEPAVFNDTKTLPLDAWHAADPELGGPGPHARYHNVYGLLMARATREGVLRARPNVRPFVLTRASHLGGQRWAATWTGDNTASWEHLDMSIPMVLNLGLSGQPFAGPDIGGYAGDGDGALFARWLGLGALLPFARGHTSDHSVDKEPWAFGPRTEATCRAALRRRYRLLPYLYTLFREASREGLPVARPVFFADPGDPALRAEDDAFLLGADLLVACRTTPDRDRAPALPRGGWRRVTLDVDDDDDPDLPELRLRPGAIVPLGPDCEWTAQKPLDPLELLVCPDAGGRAEGWLYEDAGEGWACERGAFRLTRYTARREGKRIAVRGEIVAGDWPEAARRVVTRVVE